MFSTFSRIVFSYSFFINTIYFLFYKHKRRYIKKSKKIKHAIVRKFTNGICYLDFYDADLMHFFFFFIFNFLSNLSLIENLNPKLNNYEQQKYQIRTQS